MLLRLGCYRGSVLYATARSGPTFATSTAAISSATLRQQVGVFTGEKYKPVGLDRKRNFTTSSILSTSMAGAKGTTAWDRLVRYVSAKDGKVHYGEPIVSDTKADIAALAKKGGLKVKVLEGANAVEAKPTGDEDEVKELLGPFAQKEVPVIRCIGLNYKTHILETGFDLPKNPTVFMKPGTAIADANAAIPIPKLGQAQLDYEGEFTIVIGRDCKNATPETALDYVAGYTTGNDVSCRDWQMDKDKAGMMPQWCFSKSFDNYAPVGPSVVSTKVLGDGKGLPLRTWVNGELRQESSTDDLCFGVKEIVSFCSTGQTLQAGSLIMTGTPGGVGMGFKPEPKFLKDGDVVEVEVEGLGKISNVMKFE